MLFSILSADSLQESREMEDLTRNSTISAWTFRSLKLRFSKLVIKKDTDSPLQYSVRTEFLLNSCEDASTALME